MSQCISHQRDLLPSDGVHFKSPHAYYPVGFGGHAIQQLAEV
jgi:hypothetical protein